MFIYSQRGLFLCQNLQRLSEVKKMKWLQNESVISCRKKGPTTHFTFYVNRC